MTDRILRAPQVVERVGLSASSLDRLERAGKFPRRLRLSARAVGWREKEIQEFISKLVPTRRVK